MSNYYDEIRRQATAQTRKKFGSQPAKKKTVTYYKPEQVHSNAPSTADGTANAIASARARAGINPPQQTFQPRTTGGGSGSYGYGGGGGGVSAQAAAQALADGLKSALASNMFQGQDFSGDRARIGDAVAADRGTMNSSYNALLNKLAGFQNPLQGQFAAPQKQATTYVDLLTSMGVDPTEYLATVSAADAEGAANVAAMNNSRDALRASFADGMQSRKDQAELMRTQGNSQLDAEARAMEQQIAAAERADKSKQQELRNQLILQWVQAMANAGQTADISEFIK